MPANEPNEVVFNLTATQFTLPVDPDAGWQPDNRLTRTIWGYNGQLPGPTIRLRSWATYSTRPRARSFTKVR